MLGKVPWSGLVRASLRKSPREHPGSFGPRGRRETVPARSIRSVSRATFMVADVAEPSQRSHGVGARRDYALIMTDVSRELAVLLGVVAAALVATVAAIVALIRRGRTVPLFGDPPPEASRPSKQRDGPARPVGRARGALRHAFAVGTGRKS
jgi:hypothetical protein